MHRLRPILALAVLLSFAAPGLGVAAHQVHAVLDHGHAPAEAHHDHGLDLSHGHHHEAGEPEHGHPAVYHRSPRPAALEPAPAAPWATASLGAAASEARLHAVASAPPPLHPALRLALRIPRAGPPDTLFAASISLLL